MSTAAPERTPRTTPRGPWRRLTSAARAAARPVYQWIAAGSLSSSAVGICVSALALTILGSMMVLSASSVEQISKAQSPYALFARQVGYALVGIVAMFAASRVPLRWWKSRTLIFWLMGGTIALLLLVLSPLGVEVYGNRNWLALGPLQFQPSEIGKFALVLWAAWGLAKTPQVAVSVRAALLPSILGFLATFALVMAGGDAGTGIVFALIYAGALWFARAPMKIFRWSAILGVAAAALIVVASPHRIQRVIGWLVPSRCGASDACYQSNAGLAALASGSWWGEGLGESRQKYNYLPEAHNDYIFAILGEELGFIGSLVVIALFTVIALSLARVILRSSDRFVRIAAGCMLAWYIGQAFVNIGMVTGLLPVIGIPLPFISYGGTSLMMSLFAAGFAMSLTRAPTHPALELSALEEPERTSRLEN
ncbi:cell division-specific peptidoglycan biosynthesis regulator FtsW [Kocuria sp. AG109]|uniref:FtsW/RodA/SpoVE family cell cycle protein n=1 Tax=Rothia kristinae TaxID=37923 RepID=UPI00092AB6F5|nr:cell division protein FtsW [Rothia kristinae]TDP52907.1 cell division-specific peptidoglycan biosynthesis regulator FtsW [Kocuria sp. AG109]SIM01633.1 cell division protein FtsW [Mycobacteroides abscessus subsp. abscessus]